MSDSPFLRNDYTFNRQKILKPYVDSVKTQIKLKHPELSDEQILKTVDKIIKSRIKIPSVKFNDFTDEGNVTEKEAPLTLFLNNCVSNNIFSVSGTIYIRSEKKESYLKTTIKDMIQIRKEAKHNMFLATDHDTKMSYNVIQSIVKIVMNSIIGAMKNKGSVICDLDGFNAITSVSRHCIKYGYSHVEKMLSGNLYLYNTDTLYHHCVQLINTIPIDLRLCMDTYNLYQPTADDVYEWLTHNLKNYKMKINYDKIAELINTFNNDQLAYIYYSTNLKHLFLQNTNIFKTIIKNTFTKPKDEDSLDIDINNFDFDKYDETFINMLKPFYIDEIGKDPSTGIVYDFYQSKKTQPEKLKIFAKACVDVCCILDSLKLLFKTFIVLDTDIINIHDQDKMVRNSVVLSDTDSVLASLMDMVKWYSGDTVFTTTGLEVNAFVMYILTKSLENVFARQSRQLGCSVQDQHLISMKNEFLYPVMLTTPIKKTYAGLIYIQEGNILPKLKLDIKGVAFKSSNLSGDVVKDTSDFIKDILTQSMETGTLSVTKLLDNVTEKELDVSDSIRNNHLSKYLSISSIKPKEQYLDPDRSLYKTYETYNSIFAKKYGDIFIPSKVYVVPIKNGGKYLLSKEYTEWLQEYDPTIYENLIDYIKRDKRAITRMIFPMSINIPPEIYKAVCVRTMCYTICKPRYLCLESLGLSYAYRNSTKTKTLLLSDYWVNTQRQIINNSYTKID